MSQTTFRNNLPRIRRQLHSNAGRVVRKTCAAIEAGIKVSFSEQKHGRMYGAHQASAPGEAPAIDYGTLANSVQTFMESDTKGGVGISAEHGPHLELGTSNMAPRPYAAPAAEKQRRKFQESLRNLV